MTRRLGLPRVLLVITCLLPGAPLAVGCGEECASGTVKRGGECVPTDAPPDCPDGTLLRDGVCVDVNDCGPGMALDAVTRLCVPFDGALVQLVHDAADPAAAKLDVYLDDILLLDDFEFRTATPFVQVPAGQPLTLAVAPADSTGATEALATAELDLSLHAHEIVILSGVFPRQDAHFAPNPTEPGAEQLRLFRIQDAEVESDSPTQARVAVFHGATDVPAVQLVADPLGERAAWAGPLGYGQSTAYSSVDAGLTVIEVVTAADAPARVGSFQTTAEELLPPPAGIPAGRAALVLASGFGDPDANEAGAPFALLLVLPNGATAELDRAGRMQLLHDAAGAEVGPVDLFVNAQRAASAIPFRAATPFFTVPSGVDLQLALTAPGGSPEEPLVTKIFSLPAGQDWLLAAYGVLQRQRYASNPDGRDVGLDLVLLPARERASNAGVDIVMAHGVTDAPALDVFVEPLSADRPAGAPAFDALPYGDGHGFATRRAAAYVVTVTEAGSREPLARYALDLDGLSGQGACLVASGFLDPSANRGGDGFALLLATGDGSTSILGGTARLQLIHAAPDPALAKVDLYVAETLLFDDLAFGTATPFVTAPAGAPVVVEIAPRTSGEVGAALPAGASLSRTSLRLAAGSSNVAVAAGVLDPARFDRAVNGEEITLRIALLENAASQAPGDTALVTIFHGVPDLGPVRIVVVPQGEALTNQLTYARFGDREPSGYLPLAPVDLTVSVASADGAPLGRVIQLPVPLAGAAGSVATLLLTGFLDPTDNAGGPGLDSLLVLPDGGVAEP